MLKLNLEALSAPLQERVRELLPLLDMEEHGHGIPLLAERSEEGLELYPSNDGSLVIAYHNLCEFFRGIGHIRQVTETSTPLKEKAHFEWLNYMVDVSRNGVMNLPSVKLLVRYLALMGYNNLMLYTEDTYELPDYPYFGYQRGRYTLEELRELVAYCEGFGITLSPCIQTLGHLSHALVWPTHAAMKDSADVLYVGKKETYQFLDHMFETLCSVFKTRRFNIGMDEAHSLGKGARLEKEGYDSATRQKLMQEHLKRVAELCKKHGIKPMIWSDMFFRPLQPDDAYYSSDVVVPEEVIRGVPEDFTLIYWDYGIGPADEEYRAKFEHMLSQHQRFHNPVAYAGCAWKYLGYVPNNSYSLYIGEYHLNTCLEKGIRDITLTCWSNNGAEASQFSVLPVMLLYAEKLYTGSLDSLELAPRFEAVFGVPMKAFCKLDLPNRVPDAPVFQNSSGRNPSKWLLYNDCLCGKMDRYISPDYKEFYANTAKILSQYESLPRFGYVFQTAAALCRVLTDKATLSIDLREAYLAGDKEALKQILPRIDALMEELDRFTDVLRKQWYKENKLFGFEALEMRLGAVKHRARGTKLTVEQYLKGELSSIAPLEEPVLYADGRPEDSRRSKVMTVEAYREIVPVTFSNS